MATTITKEHKTWIDEAKLIPLLRKWRHGLVGDSIFEGETGEYFAKRLFGFREADPAAWTAASKLVGW